MITEVGDGDVGEAVVIEVRDREGGRFRAHGNRGGVLEGPIPSTEQQGQRAVFEIGRDRIELPVPVHVPQCHSDGRRQLDLEWIGVCAVMRRSEARLAERRPLPLRTLEEILADPEETEEPPETCGECGGLIESYTGLAACPETAVAVAVYQLDLLAGAREDGIDDLFDLLDELETDESERRAAGEPRTPKARERWGEELAELESCRWTCQWLIDQGAETVGHARALLLAEAGRLADLHGDPDGLLKPAPAPRAVGAKVGRNDPCPCGSGRKYKRCCLGKA